VALTLFKRKITMEKEKIYNLIILDESGSMERIKLINTEIVLS